MEELWEVLLLVIYNKNPNYKCVCTVVPNLEADALAADLSI